MESRNRAPGPELVSFSLDGLEESGANQSLNYLTVQDFQNLMDQQLIEADDDATSRKTSRFSELLILTNGIWLV